MKGRGKYSELTKNMLVLFIGNLSSKVLVFLLVPIYTRVLSSAEYGVYDLSVSTAQMIFPILSLNIIDCILRFALDKTKDATEVFRIARMIVSINCVLAGICASLIFFLSPQNEIKEHIWLILLYYIFYSYNQMFLQVVKAIDRVSAIAATGFVSSIVLFGTTFLFLFPMQLGLKGFFLSNILSQCSSFVMYLFACRSIWIHKLRKSTWDKMLCLSMLKYSVPLIAITLCWWVNSNADKYVVLALCEVSVTGLLATAYKIPNVLSVLSGIFTQAWQITAIKEYDAQEETGAFYTSAFSKLNFVACSGIAICIPLTKIFATILFAKEFYEAWTFVPFLLVSVLFTVASGFLGPILTAGYQVKMITISGLVGMILNVVLNIGLTLLIGPQGVVIATAISSFAIFFVRLYAMKGKDFHFGKRNGFAWCLVVLSAVSYVFFDFEWISLVLSLLTIALFSKDIQDTFMMLKKAISAQRK